MKIWQAGLVEPWSGSSSFSMEESVTAAQTTEKDSFILCRNSQGTPLRGSLMHFSSRNAIFEVYNPFSILQLSEVLNDFRIVIGERTLYAGRGVVSSLVNTGIMLVCEVTLVDAWNDVDVLSILSDRDVLRSEVQRFVSDWKTNNAILPEFKVLINDFVGFLSELSLWLKQVEVTLARTARSDVDQINQDLVDRVLDPIRPLAGDFLGRLELLAEDVPPELCGIHKAYLRRGLHPLTLCSPFVHRTFTKPLGYAGDYEMINMILGDPRQGASIFAKTVNALLLEAAVAEAHRNRILILKRMLMEAGERAVRENRECKVLNVACGPAREVAEFIRSSELANRCEITLLDFSKEALAYARADILRAKQEAGSQIKVNFVEKSIDTLLRESISRGSQSSLVDEQFHVVYCAGLFDYLADSVCRRLLSLFYEWLLPGGLLMSTNVHRANPQKHTMEYLLEWNIVHRDEADMSGLIVMGENRRAFVDQTGLNVFLTVNKLRSG